MILATLALTSGYAANPDEQTSKKIRIIPVERTPEPDHVSTRILFPKNKELESSSPIKGQIQLEGYPLGTDSDFPRKKEIYNDNEGQALHVFVDNQPYFTINEALINALDDVEEYFEQRADFEIPFKLQPGMHIIRAFPVRSFNESLKGNRCFAATLFYYRKKVDNPQIDLSRPYITYNEPQGEYSYHQEEPILLDFYITNCRLSEDGYKVRVTLDNQVTSTLSSWQPYYIYGLKKGLHRIRLELLEPSGTLASGMLNDIQRTIVIK